MVPRRIRQVRTERHIFRIALAVLIVCAITCAAFQHPGWIACIAGFLAADLLVCIWIGRLLRSRALRAPAFMRERI